MHTNELLLFLILFRVSWDTSSIFMYSIRCSVFPFPLLRSSTTIFPIIIEKKIVCDFQLIFEKKRKSFKTIANKTNKTKDKIRAIVLYRFAYYCGSNVPNLPRKIAIYTFVSLPIWEWNIFTSEYIVHHIRSKRSTQINAFNAVNFCRWIAP